MAHFIPVQFGSGPGTYINLDLVRAVTPLTKGCLVHFDHTYTMAINETANAVVAAAEHFRQTEHR